MNNINFLEEMSNFKTIQTYSRHTSGTREQWGELVKRSLNMHLSKFSNKLAKEDLDDIKWCFNEMVTEQYVCPSMRSLQFAGEAIKVHNASMFNCTVAHIDSFRRMAEGFYLLLCGCGVTFGLNDKHLSKFPDMISKADDYESDIIKYRIEDTIQGWADSLEVLMMSYFENNPFSGRNIIFDYSGIRRKGTILKTRGGKAPGPVGLKNAHKKIKKILNEALTSNQPRIKTIQVYDILMHCADSVLSGGIRRAATAVIFDPDDDDMIKSKGVFNVEVIESNFKSEDNLQAYVKIICNGGKKYSVNFNLDVPFEKYDYDQLIRDKVIAWNKIEPQRGRSNNSIRLIRGNFTYDEFVGIFNSTRQFGEPGFVFCDHEDTLMNPCFEVSFIPILKDGRGGFQMCNLTTQNGSKITSKEIWKRCVKAATIIGTLQATYTDFTYISHESKLLTEEEALLGVSLTGWMDNPDVLLNAEWQKEMAEYAVEVNKEWSEKLGIYQAARVTLVKPEGTSSIVLKSASGAHAHHDYRYFRRIQVNKEDNVYKYFKKHNPHVCEESVWSANKTDDVITFPIEVPDHAMVKSDLDAKKHLEIIKGIQKNWINTGTTDANKKPLTHNCSCTVIVDEKEWDWIPQYLFDNQNNFSAVSLLSKSGDKDYQQAPMEAITTPEDEIKWDNIVKNWVSVDYSLFTENSDGTTKGDTVACGGGSCEIFA
jgi:ribonucleoside-diphosphate reductase alpha chain